MFASLVFAHVVSLRADHSGHCILRVWRVVCRMCCLCVSVFYTILCVSVCGCVSMHRVRQAHPARSVLLRRRWQGNPQAILRQQRGAVQGHQGESTGGGVVMPPPSLSLAVLSAPCHSCDHRNRVSLALALRLSVSSRLCARVAAPVSLCRTVSLCVSVCLAASTGTVLVARVPWRDHRH
jgi:hypothetical protein